MKNHSVFILILIFLIMAIGCSKTNKPNTSAENSSTTVTQSTENPSGNIQSNQKGIIEEKFWGEFRYGDDPNNYVYFIFEMNTVNFGYETRMGGGGSSREGWTVGNDLMTVEGKFGTFMDSNSFVNNIEDFRFEKGQVFKRRIKE